MYALIKHLFRWQSISWKFIRQIVFELGLQKTRLKNPQSLKIKLNWYEQIQHEYDSQMLPPYLLISRKFFQVKSSSFSFYHYIIQSTQYPNDVEYQVQSQKHTIDVNTRFSMPIVLEYNKEQMRIAKVSKSIIIDENPAQSFAGSMHRKTDLKKIIELTEQNPPAQPQNSAKQPSKALKSSQINFKRFNSFITCLSNLWRYICYSSNALELDANDADFNNLIASIKNRKKHFHSVLPPQKEQKKVLVLDLDETLVHTTFSKPAQFDYQSQVFFNGKPTKIYTSKRFGLQAFLFQMSKLYEIIIFTASQRLYADKIIDLIDPKKRVSHRLYRQHCIVVNKSYYLKNLNILGRNVKDIVIVDDNNKTGLLQPDNFYRIQPFQGNIKDRQLCRLSAFLKHLHQETDILPIRDRRKSFEEIQINLQEEVLGQIRPQHLQARTLNQRKKQYRHKMTNSEVQALVVASQTQTQAQTTASDLFKKF